MRWKAVVMNEIMKKQGHRCSLCRERFDQAREVAVERISLKVSPLELANYRAIHEQCHPAKKKAESRADRLEQIVRMIKEKRSQLEISRELGVSLRTFYRYMNAVEREGLVR